MNIQAIKPGPKRTATSTGKPDQRQRDNKGTPGNTPSLKPSKSTTKKQSHALLYILILDEYLKLKNIFIILKNN